MHARAVVPRPTPERNASSAALSASGSEEARRRGAGELACGVEAWAGGGGARGLAAVGHASWRPAQLVGSGKGEEERRAGLGI
jgi:hypothetical protein